MPMYTDKEIRHQLDLYADVHPAETMEAWGEIDEILRRDHSIRLPEAAVMAEGDSLERLHLRTNYSKVVVQSTVTMVLASGLTIRDGQGLVLRGRNANPFPMRYVRRMLRYMSQYGAAWKLRRPNDRKLPLRVYKPHVAREIHLETDPDIVKAVLAIEEIPYREGQYELGQTYRRARWYEWIDVDGNKQLEPDEWRQVIRKTYISEAGGEWQAQRDGAIFRYMPMQLIHNRDADPDRLFEASDIWDAMPLFKALDDLSTKYLKALEDEAFRITFLANVTDEQFKSMRRLSSLNFMFADNGPDGKEPRPYWANPADHRQYLDAFKHFMNRIATMTRTSPLELDERPVQDIPAQTLRVLYGPQISRCAESAEYAASSLSDDLQLIPGQAGVDVILQPRLPISEDKIHQNSKGMLDSDAYSRRQLLIDTGKTEAEAERILDEAIEEKRRIAEIAAEVEGDREERLLRVEAAVTPSSTPPREGS